jgi:cytochrome c oxidase subunit 2
MIFVFSSSTSNLINSIYSLWEKYISEKVLCGRNHGNIRELLWTILPTFILLIISIPSLELLYLLDGFGLHEGPVFTYKVIGHQWFWSYEYLSFKNEQELSFDSYMLFGNDLYTVKGPRLLEVDNSLIVPAYSNIQFLITSVDVLHSWAVPSLGIKVDAVPGRLSQIYVLIKREGIFYGQCSEICGVNHGFMPIKVEAINLSI